MANLKITLRRSLIGRPKEQHRVLQSLGLGKKINSSVVVPDKDNTRRSIKRIAHLVEVEEINE